MIRLLKRGWWFGSALLLSGCGALTDNALIGGEDAVFRDRGQDYEESQVQKPLEVPPHLSSDKIRTLLPVPDIGEAAIESEQEFEVPRPDFFIAEAGNDKVNMAREGRERLIIVDDSKAEVWSKLQSFWDENQQEIVITDPERGMMETAWIDSGEEQPGFFSRLVSKLTSKDVQGPAHDKLRAFIKPIDGDAGKTSIRLRHLRAPLNDPNQQPDWGGAAEDVDYKSQLMYELLHYLSQSSVETTASAAQQRAQQSGRVFIGRSSLEQPVLKLTVSVDQAWTLLEQALLKAQVDVGSSDRSLGKYYVTYTATVLPEEAESPGFFDWLHGEREDIMISSDAIQGALGVESEEADSGPRYSSKPAVVLDDSPEAEQQRLKESDGYKIWLGDRVIYVFGSDQPQPELETDPDTGDIRYTGRYQIKLTRRSSGVYVTVLNEQAEPAPHNIAEELLWDLKEQMPATEG